MVEYPMVFRGRHSRRPQIPLKAGHYNDPIFTDYILGQESRSEQSQWVNNTFLTRAVLSRIDNAYVAGMKEELGFYGNELIRLQTIYIVGAVLGQLPFLFLFTYLPMYWVLPGMDIGWGIFTLLQFRANSYAEMMAYRFFVGWFEVCVGKFFVDARLEADWTRGCLLSRRSLCSW